jgi:tRNA-2-methylthio-N6-dimethylallyladenosine synthase
MEGIMLNAQIILTSCSRRGLEIEQLKSYLQGNGYHLLRDDWNVHPETDLILLSTCGFTQAAEDFGFETLQRVQATKKPGARVVFGGCIPEINSARVRAVFDGPTFSPQSYSRLDEIIGAQHPFIEFKRPNTFAEHGSALITDARRAVDIIKTFDGSWSGLGYISQRLGSGVRQRVIRTKYANLENQRTFYIQIQEGCSMHCSYCAIRMAIGPLRSRPLEAILEEISSGVSQGYQHIQLMGDNAGSYGLDIGTNMGKLLERIMEVAGDFVLDLTDINPVYLASMIEPIKMLCMKKKISRLYVPIQSASRRILKLMGRDCDIESVKRMLIEIKRLSPLQFKMGTSLIAGFPSEEVSELNATIKLCEEVGFDWVWCHSFSARPETPAAALPGQLPAEEILRRSLFVKAQLGKKSLVTTANDTAGNRTCQG